LRRRVLSPTLALLLALQGVSLRAADETASHVRQTTHEGRYVSGQASRELASPAPQRDDGRRTLGRLPVNIGRGFVGVFSRESLAPLLIGGAVAGGAHFLDDDLRDLANPDHGFGETLETAGGPIISGSSVLGLFTAGRLAHGERFRAMTYDLFGAAFVTMGYTSLIKAAVSRERPNGEDEKSFPSGHTSNAFTLATVAERHYGWKLGAPAYAVAAFVDPPRLPACAVGGFSGCHGFGEATPKQSEGGRLPHH